MWPGVSVSICFPSEPSSAAHVGMRIFSGINHVRKVKCVEVQGGSGPVSVGAQRGGKHS